MCAPGRRLLSHLLAGLRAAARAPRLFRAARRAGAGWIESSLLLGISAVVLLVVAPRAGGVPGRQNAVRHFVWQAMLTARHGEAVARAVAEAQEYGSSEPEDSVVDQHNNAVAREYGAAHAAELASRSTAAALRELLHAGLAKWEAGELSGWPATARAAGRRRGWRGRATPRTRS